jgi:hypothetical protein
LYTYDEGASVRVSAVASPGYAFLEWRGSLTGSKGTELVVMNGEKSVTAVFVRTGEETPRSSPASDQDTPTSPVESADGSEMGAAPPPPLPGVQALVGPTQLAARRNSDGSVWLWWEGRSPVSGYALIERKELSAPDSAYEEVGRAALALSWLDASEAAASGAELSYRVTHYYEGQGYSAGAVAALSLEGAPRVLAVEFAAPCSSVYPGVTPPLPIRFSVDWQGLSPHSASWSLGREGAPHTASLVSVPGEAEVDFALDTGAFRDAQETESLWVRIAGADASGRVVWSAPTEVGLSGVRVGQLPLYIASLVDLAGGFGFTELIESDGPIREEPKKGRDVSYTISMADGSPVFKISFTPNIPLPNDWTMDIPTQVPVLGPIFGGHYELKIKKPQFDLSISCAELGLGGGMGIAFEKSAGDWDFEVALAGSLAATSDTSLNFKEGSLTFVGQATGGHTWDLLDVIPQLALLKKVPLIGDYVDQLADALQLTLALKGGAKVSFGLAAQDPGLSWWPGVGFTGAAGDLLIGSEISVHTPKELKLVSAHLTFDSAFTFSFASPGPEDQFIAFKGLTITGRLSGGFKIDVGLILTSIHYSAEFDIPLYFTHFSPPECLVGDLGDIELTATFRPYATPGYNTFLGEAVDIVDSRIIETRLVSQAFPEAEPCVASTGSETICVWAADDMTVEIGGATDIYFSRKTANVWSAPRHIAENVLPEGQPTLAVDASGRFVCAWVQLIEGRALGTELSEAMVGGLEVVFSVYDPVADSWSAAQTVTRNAVLDYCPQIVADPAGGMGLVWVRNASNRLMASTDAPDEVLASFWNGSEFGDEQVLSARDAAVLRSFAMTGTRLVYVAADGGTNSLDSARVAVLEDGVPPRTCKFDPATLISLPTAAMFEEKPAVAYVSSTDDGPAICLAVFDEATATWAEEVVQPVESAPETVQAFEFERHVVLLTTLQTADGGQALALFRVDGTSAPVVLKTAFSAFEDVSPYCDGEQLDIACMEYELSSTSRDVTLQGENAVTPGETLSRSFAVQERERQAPEVRLLEVPSLAEMLAAPGE